MEALEWPQHVDLGNLPEGAQWRFADPQDSAAAQVTRRAVETVLRHVATMCETASSMLGMEAEIALRIVSGHMPAHFSVRQCSSCLAFRLPHMLCFVTMYLKLRIHAIERFHNTWIERRKLKRSVDACQEQVEVQLAHWAWSTEGGWSHTGPYSLPDCISGEVSSVVVLFFSGS